MPQPMMYKSHSVVYFSGDKAQKVYVVQSGCINLTQVDIETGEEVQTRVTAGEFFGLRSTMGGYLRDEHAISLTDSVIIAMNLEEFEKLILANPRIANQLLKQFSKYLRHLHAKVKNILAQQFDDEETDIEESFFNIVKDYYKMKNNRYAKDTATRYLNYYPDGKFCQEATAILEGTMDDISAFDNSEQQQLELNSAQEEQPSTSKTGKNMEIFDNYANLNTQADSQSDEEQDSEQQKYFEAENYMGQEQYEEAAELFEMVAESDSITYRMTARLEFGRCLIRLNRFADAILQFKQIIQEASDDSNINRAAYYTGVAYSMLGEHVQASNILQKLTQRKSIDPSLLRRTYMELRRMKNVMK